MDCALLLLARRHIADNVNGHVGMCRTRLLMVVSFLLLFLLSGPSFAFIGDICHACSVADAGVVFCLGRLQVVFAC